MIGTRFRRYPPLTRRPEFYRARAGAKKVRDVNYKRTEYEGNSGPYFSLRIKITRNITV